MTPGVGAIDTRSFRYSYDVTYLKNKEFVERNQLWAFCDEEK